MGGGASKKPQKNNRYEPNIISPNEFESTGKKNAKNEKKKEKKDKKLEPKKGQDFENILPKHKPGLKFSESQLVNDAVMNSSFTPAPPKMVEAMVKPDPVVPKEKEKKKSKSKEKKAKSKDKKSNKENKEKGNLLKKITLDHIADTNKPKISLLQDRALLHADNDNYDDYFQNAQNTTEEEYDILDPFKKVYSEFSSNLQNDALLNQGKTSSKSLNVWSNLVSNVQNKSISLMTQKQMLIF